MRSVVFAVAAAMLVAGAAQAFPSAHKTIKDWTAVCNNIGTCAAFGFPTADDPDGAYLEITREAGPAAAPSLAIVFDSGDTQPNQTWSLVLDGHPVPGVAPLAAVGSDGGARATLNRAAALALIDAMRNGTKLDLVAAGKRVASISMAGSAATLLWVDVDQGRVGTVTALGAKGTGPASGVPAAAPVPLITAAPAVSQAGLPTRAPTRLAKGVSDCADGNIPSGTPDDIVARLAPGVVLWGPECDMAAYNESSVFFIGDEHAGHLRRITFPDPAGESAAGDDEIVNADFDATSQMLASFDKGRGIADCGSTTDWVWNGKAFVLISEDFMSECHGVSSEDWPSLFISRQK
ncbi:MAG TPA: DUF1176 domain-containing protein [Caulobacteraceae bacterium]|nr:DUF1176 domain-containing protein [Caulobacteraceae bacterium]